MRTNYGIIEPEYVEASWDFAINMYKKGGFFDACKERSRTPIENFCNAFSGKLCEFGVYQYYDESYKGCISYPDCRIYEEKCGDGGVDFIFSMKNGYTKKIDVKSSYEFVNNVAYAEHQYNKNNLVSDIFVFVKVNYGFLDELKNGKKRFDMANIDELKDVIVNRKYYYIVEGYLTKEKMIEEFDSHYVDKHTKDARYIKLSGESVFKEGNYVWWTGGKCKNDNNRYYDSELLVENNVFYLHDRREVEKRLGIPPRDFNREKAGDYKQI